MDYKRMGDNIYVRIDKEKEIIIGVMEVCKKGEIYAHSIFYTKENDETEILAGHTLRTVVSYAAEIVVMPAQGVIRRTTEQGTGAQIWHLY